MMAATSTSSWTLCRRLLTTTHLLSLTTHPSSAFTPNPYKLKLKANSINLRPLGSKLAAMIDPPIARREEDRVAYAGAAPPNWDPSNPRQASDSPNPLLDPPVAIPDPYGWLRDDSRSNPEILDYLKQENAYGVQFVREEVRDGLYKELLKSVQETDYTTPRPRGDYWYYTRTFEGKSYTAYCRAPKTSDTFSIDWDGSKESPIFPGEEVYLDVNELAVDKSYCSVGSVKPSKSHEWIAYTVDYKGDEKYELHVKNLKNGQDVIFKDLEDGKNKILEVSDSLVWGQDENTLYYMTMDEQQRPDRLYQRRGWNTDSPVETLLKEERDDLYWCDVSKSLDGKYIFFDMASKETSEVWYLATEDEESVSPSSTDEKMQCIAPRRNKVLYEVEHAQNQWFISTNVNDSPNMKLMTSPAIPNSSDKWTLLLDSSDEPLFDGSLTETFKSLESVMVLKSHVVIQGREDGVPRIWVYDLEGRSVKRLEFEEEAYDVDLLGHYDSDTKVIGVAYDSMVTPTSSLEISLSDDSQRTVLKVKNVPGYQKDLYETERLEVLSRDGSTKIPISVVYSKETMEKVKKGERVPLHLYGYGSYGASMEAYFSSNRLPLLERGMIYVIAHIRGGAEMGRQWYEEPNGAKYLCKKNTFNDFVDVARALVDDLKWTSSDMLSCEGRSAGGLLIGASINQAPELFRVAILGVPFVDVVVTMTDSTIPLTSGEWVEWGNPNEEKFYSYMMEYSPMNNVQKGKTYPSCWITGGLNDPRVAYWEPAKFTATLRSENPNNSNPICLKMDLEAGHFSASDRYKYYKELATDYAFLLDQLKLV